MPDADDDPEVEYWLWADDFCRCIECGVGISKEKLRPFETKDYLPFEWAHRIARLAHDLGWRVNENDKMVCPECIETYYE